jgi:hypothetical protein
MLQSLRHEIQPEKSEPNCRIEQYIYSDVPRLAAQCSPKHSDDQSKADFLKAAVDNQPWARSAVEEYLFNPSSF